MKLRRTRRPLSLQVTSLLDMFTIILVFLMVSFEADAVEVEQTPGVTLPSSDARVPLEDAPEIAVTATSVLVEGEAVSPLEPLALEAISAALPVSEGERAVIIKADRDTDYDLLHQVLTAAASAGRDQHHLLIERE